MSKETYTYQKRPTQIKHDLHVNWEAGWWSRTLKVTYTCQKRPIHVKRDLYMSNETYTYQKRPAQIKHDLHVNWEAGWWSRTLKVTYAYQTRPIDVKRDLYISKETYTYQTRITRQLRGKLTFKNSNGLYRVAKTHRMPSLYRSFSAKEPYNQWLFSAKCPST